MIYLTTHSTHFIYGYMASDMVKDHSDSDKGNPLPPHRLLLSINSKGYFICTIPHTTVFVTPVVEHWLERGLGPGSGLGLRSGLEVRTGLGWDWY